MVIFCSDIDGTLLNPERTISKRTVDAVRAVTDAGHVFMLCSSRMPSSMRILESLYGGVGVPLIAYNGGLVLNPDGSVALDVTIDAVDARAIYETCRELDLHGSFYAGDEWFAWGKDFWSDRESNNTAVFPSSRDAADYYESGDIGIRPPHKIMCMGESHLVDQVETMLGDVAGLVTYRSKDTYLEIANAACSKGDGLRIVASELDVDLSECVFFGDNFNDLPAFGVAGTSVAVANAKQAVLDAATVVTERHHDDGVAVYLEDFLKASQPG